MALDIDFIAAKEAIDKLRKLLSSLEHGEREGIADDIEEFVGNMERKWKGWKAE